MRLSDFDFELPPAQIAQAPSAKRGGSRLLVVDRSTGALQHKTFSVLPDLLRAGDLLVVNDTRVVPARLLGQKAGTGGKVELLVVRPASQVETGAAFDGDAGALDWICLGQASKGIKAGTELSLAEGLSATVQEPLGGGEYRVRFYSRKGTSFAQILERAGRLPLPPYITRPPTAEDAGRYQTVYARAAGSVAAPTAGLHFTPELLAELENKGVRRAELTLDVGPGTFLPIRGDDVSAHVMHPERYRVPAQTARAVNEAHAQGRRVIAVGTTVVRTLEAATDAESGQLRAGEGETRLFISPGFRFRQVAALLTNFHLPKSTLVILVSAFLGRDRTLATYREAVAEGYRFFSYGDAMFISGELS
ncbi:MAG: tRNA preQ1(34) S-adenosylmethionine ribosyltransferase-isomerase QueA [Myxococcaceae bacterium]